MEKRESTEKDEKKRMTSFFDEENRKKYDKQTHREKNKNKTRSKKEQKIKRHAQS